MIARLGTFDPMSSDVLAEYRRNLEERFLPALKVQDGFVAAYWLQTPDGTQHSLTVWESEEAFQEGARRANATPLLPGQDSSKIPSPTSVVTYEVVARA